MTLDNSSRPLAERISPREIGDDPWSYDRDVVDEVFAPRPRKHRKQVLEEDSEYLYTPWVDNMQLNGNDSKEQR
jgi:hypothetical protein